VWKSCVSQTGKAHFDSCQVTRLRTYGEIWDGEKVPEGAPRMQPSAVVWPLWELEVAVVGVWVLGLVRRTGLMGLQLQPQHPFYFLGNSFHSSQHASFDLHFCIIQMLYLHPLPLHTAFLHADSPALQGQPCFLSWDLQPKAKSCLWTLFQLSPALGCQLPSSLNI